MSSSHDDHDQQIAATHRIMEQLLECGTSQERSAVLLNSLLEAGLCQSAALWRQVGTGTTKAWHPVLARGPASLLPTLDQLRAVTRGELGCELSGGRYVLLPIGRHNFALTLGTRLPGDDLSEERLDSADALFHVWLAVEVAESVGQSQNLLDALPSLSDIAGQHNTHTPWQTPLLETPTLEHFIEGEASWLLDSNVELNLVIEPTPALALSRTHTETLLRDLLSHGAAGQSIRPMRVGLSVQAAEDGAVITVQDDGGWPPSMQGETIGRFSSGLFDAARLVQNVGGEFSFSRSPLGGSCVKVWIPGL